MSELNAKQIDIHVACAICGRSMASVQVECRGERHSHYRCLTCGGTTICVIPRFRLDGRALPGAGGVQ